MPAKAKKVNKARMQALAQVKRRVSAMSAPKKNPPQRRGRGLLPILGGVAGEYFGGPSGGILGRAAGDLLSEITGFGQYKIQRNSISEGNSIASFRQGGDGMKVCHSEFLSDVVGTVDFAVTSYPINPGMPETNPWLRRIAEQFEEYEMDGLIFQYKPSSGSAVSSTSSALGVVVMATNYDAAAPVFTSKQQMESYEYATSCVPFVSSMHPVECKRGLNVMNNLFVRTEAPPDNTDIRLYDMGNFQIATAGMQSVYTVGELWIIYDVRFRKPRLGPLTSVSTGVYARFHENASFTASAAHFFGLSGDTATCSYPDSNLNTITIVTGNYLQFSQPGEYFLAVYLWSETATTPVITATAGSNISLSAPGSLFTDSEPYIHAKMDVTTAGTNPFPNSAAYIGSVNVQTAGSSSANRVLLSSSSYGDNAAVDVMIVPRNADLSLLLSRSRFRRMPPRRALLKQPLSPFIEIPSDSLEEKTVKLLPRAL